MLGAAGTTSTMAHRVRVRLGLGLGLGFVDIRVRVSAGVSVAWCSLRCTTLVDLEVCRFCARVCVTAD